MSGAQSRVSGAQGRLFSGNYSRFGADRSSGDLLFFQDHGLVSGEKAALLSQFSQADAGGFVFVVFQRLETWPCGLAAFLPIRAAWVEGAAAGWVERRWWISGKQDTFASTLAVGVGHWHCAAKRLGVRVLRVLEHFRRRAYLDDAAEVHHGDAVGDMFHHRQVV